MVEIEQQAVPERQAMSAEAVFPADEWVERLSMSGPVRDEAIRALHTLMIRAARHQVARMPEATSLGSVVHDEIINSAADEATIAVLGRLDSFEGRSRFTTWAYKFGILQAGVHVRRTRWRGREVQLRQIVEPVESHVRSPEAHVEGGDVASAVSRAMATCLTPHQHKVAVALLVDEVPIDVLSERLGTTRNALYKTLHDVRKRLRVELIAQGHTLMGASEEVNR